MLLISSALALGCFSAVVSYLLAPKIVAFDWGMIIMLFIGGLLVTGSANAVNQVVEKDTDAMMNRTAKRPVASGRMSTAEGWTFAIVAGLAGVFILWYFFNGLSAIIAAFSWLYMFYVPATEESKCSVSSGWSSFPGALPCSYRMGSRQESSPAGGWVLFSIQFFWAVPSFWAIA